MSFKWPIKDPDETLDYSVDWLRFLGDATISSVIWFVKTSEVGKTQLGSGQTLTTASSSAVTDDIQNVSQSNTSTVATINIGGGVLNREYTFSCKMTDSTGSTAERSIKLSIREK
tara:strand:+ start:822 stop:1166 length:345 start_codon:yes stop_codon:yes gene_type:complete